MVGCLTTLAAGLALARDQVIPCHTFIPHTHPGAQHELPMFLRLSILHTLFPTELLLTGAPMGEGAVDIADSGSNNVFGERAPFIFLKPYVTKSPLASLTTHFAIDNKFAASVLCD